MKKKILAAMLAGAMVLSMAGCSGGADNSSDDTASDSASSEDSGSGETAEETEIQVFIAASLNTVMTELADMYNEEHPEVKITYNADSSGTLLTQIQEGYECDIFFSAAQKQMDDLEADGLMVKGTRADVVNNQVVVVSLKDSGTKVTGLENLNEAESIALAGGSVPVGRYTRQALVNLYFPTENVNTVIRSPLQSRVELIANVWAPYRSVATWFLWRSLENTPLEKESE